MDEFRLWQEDYRREVDEVLASMRGARTAAPSLAAPPQVVPPAGVMRELAEARAALEKLRPAVDELRRELAVREAALTKETRRRGRFKDLASKMQTAIRRLDEELGAARRRFREEGLRARDLASRLRAALHDRRRLAAELELDKRKILQWASDARVLQGRVNELELACDAKQSALAALQERFDAAQRRAEEQAAAREAKIAELVSLNETLSTQRKLAADSASASKDERTRLEMERGAVFERLQQALADLKTAQSQLKGGAAQSTELAGELARAREGAAALKAELAAAAKALEQSRAQLAQEQTARRLAERENGELSAAREERDRLRAHIAREHADHAKIREDLSRADAELADARRLKEEADVELAQARELARKAEESKAAALKDLAEEKKALEARQAAERAAESQTLALAEARQAERRRIEEESRALLERANKILSAPVPAAKPEPRLTPPPSAAKPVALSPARAPEPEKPKGLWGRVKKLWEDRE